MADAEPNSMNAAEILLGPALDRGAGDSTAILCRDQSITYAALDAAASRFAAYCRSRGLEVRERVLLLVDDRPAFFQVYLGAMKAGLVPVALNLRLPAEELRHILVDSGSRLVVVEEDLLAQLVDALEGIETPPAIVTTSDVPGETSLDSAIEDQPETFDPVPLAPDDMALWMYTSGTTGRPKAAIHLQRAIATTERYFGATFGVTADDRIYATSKLFFAYALGHCLLATLRLGATAVLSPGWPTPDSVAADVERHRPTVMLSVPTFYRNLLAEGMAARDGFRDVRLYLSAGERLPPDIAKAWSDATGRPIVEGLGATETLMMVLANRPGDTALGTIGHPLPGVEARRLDEDGLPVADADTPGILSVRSESIADGYWNRPEPSTAAFDKGWFRTGDIVALDDESRYSHLGRGDDMMKISGQWVSPTEIEDLVLGQPGVRTAAVVGVRDGDDLERLALCLVTESEQVDRVALEATLSQCLQANLAIYKCPRRFVYLDDLPCTATGKLQRYKLREIVTEILGEGS